MTSSSTIADEPQSETEAAVRLFDNRRRGLTVYRFNTGAAQYYFCSRCGINTHHRRRSNPNQYGVNVACLKGVSPFAFADMPVTAGVTGHRHRHRATLLGTFGQRHLFALPDARRGGTVGRRRQQSPVERLARQA